jgi:hypothetical protein
VIEISFLRSTFGVTRIDICIEARCQGKLYNIDQKGKELQGEVGISLIPSAN